MVALVLGALRLAAPWLVNVIVGASAFTTLAAAAVAGWLVAPIAVKVHKWEEAVPEPGGTPGLPSIPFHLDSGTLLLLGAGAIVLMIVSGRR